MGRMWMFWILYLLALSAQSTSGIRTLNSTRDLADNNIAFGKTFPRHGLKLLYWLTHDLQCDQNNVIQLRNLEQQENMNLDSRPYGFHMYCNREECLPPSLNPYYTLGNLNNLKFPHTIELPSYVRDDYDNNRNNRLSNRDRVVVEVDTPSTEDTPRRVIAVYITEHYDQQNTYRLSPQLLREIRSITSQEEFFRQAGYDFDGLKKYYSKNFNCKFPDERSSIIRHFQHSVPGCNTHEVVSLEVTSSDTANARITWSNIPDTTLSKNLYVRLFANMDSTECLSSFRVTEPSGSIDTSVRLDNRLQVRLRECRFDMSWFGTDIWNGPEFDDANKKLPTQVLGYNASLQLFVREGKACARLYISGAFSDWRSTFYYAWVGFYQSSGDGHSSYGTWQWATKFNKNTQTQIKEQHTSLIYEYDSGLDVGPGFQARFFLQKPVGSVLAFTVPWGREATKQIHNNVGGYDASLHLTASGGYALARLYIKRDFTNWGDAFYYSWVGFYESSSKQNSSYYTYQWVTKFTQNEEQCTEEYLAYDYTSSMTIGLWEEARFFLTKDYSTMIGRAELDLNPPLLSGCG
ncbi:uncharacterized protein LOC134075188 [Sardina pilchardus]|uniref:uncharacterized protein LOC134075188 n=1 Tax=Sardina pilchardus TaxID=27697 RepID=UPI002E10D722